MEIKIGQILYAYNSPRILEYEVFGVTQLETKKFYLLRCKSCNHGRQCEIACLLDDYKELAYSHMLNDDEDDRQFYWHAGAKFFKTRNEARVFIHNKNLKYYEEIIIKSEEKIKECQSKIEETKTEIELLTQSIND